MGTVAPAKKVFEVIYADLIGPLPTSAGGRQNQFLLVVVDQLSKWVEMFPLREATSDKITNLLEDQVEHERIRRVTNHWATL